MKNRRDFSAFVEVSIPSGTVFELENILPYIELKGEVTSSTDTIWTSPKVYAYPESSIMYVALPNDEASIEYPKDLVYRVYVEVVDTPKESVSTAFIYTSPKFVIVDVAAPAKYALNDKK